MNVATDLFFVNGNKVQVMPSAVLMQIHCPFPKPIVPTLEQSRFVAAKIDMIVNYLITEGWITPAPNVKIPIQFLTTHPA